MTTDWQNHRTFEPGDPRVRIKLDLTPEHVLKLDVIAEREGVSRTTVIRRACELLADEYERAMGIEE